MRTQSQFGILISILFLTGSFLDGVEEKLPNDVRWVRQSTEHKTLCEQLFRQATVTILRTGKTEKSTGNLAVVVDLDEVYLAFALFRKIDVSESTMLDVIVRLKKMIEMHK